MERIQRKMSRMEKRVEKLEARGVAEPEPSAVKEEDKPSQVLEQILRKISRIEKKQEVRGFAEPSTAVKENELFQVLEKKVEKLDSIEEKLDCLLKGMEAKGDAEPSAVKEDEPFQVL